MFQKVELIFIFSTVVFSILQKFVFPYKILLVSPQLVSHVLKQATVGSVLLEAGHEVHIALESKFDQKLVNKFKNEGFKLDFFEEPDDFIRFSSKDFKRFIGNKIFNVTIEFIDQISWYSELVNKECEYMMRDEKFLEEIKNVGFDLVLAEPFIVHMCSLILPKYLNIPFVSKASTYNGLHIRSPALPSFFPRHFISLDIHREMGFHARFSMLLGSIFLSSSWSPMNRNRTLLQKYAPGVESWEELLRESLLFFYESDHHFNNFLPSFPNHISLAGSTCAPPKPLPENILKFIEGRIVNGREPDVIVMTFGATAEFIPREVVKKFLKSFSSLNETIIAKFLIENDDTEMKSLIPPNVLILNWLPQNDVLGHPSTKLFITHCGNNGQHEALYHGVPMLGFPLFAEQDDNSRRMTALQFGLTMNVFTFTEEELIGNIKEILQNPKYKNSIGRMSDAFKNQPMAAQEKALFWIEHVIKHGGSHLRSSAMDLTLYQFLCLDTITILILSIVVIGFVLVKIFSFVFRFASELCYIYLIESKDKDI